jgi:PAS domain S-box-containing protein
VPGKDPEAEASLLRQLGRAVIATDMDGVITYWNAEAARTYGWSEEEAIGREIYYILPAALPDDEIERMMRGFAAGKEWSGELVIRRKDGAWLRTLHHDRPVRDDTGNIIGVVSVSESFDTRAVEEDADRRRAVRRPIVRRMLLELGGDGHSSNHKMRQMGRMIARTANCPGMNVYLEAFSGMGLGDLTGDSATSDRYHFSGADLIEVLRGSRQPTCALALGFLETAIEQLTGTIALGAETSCQSMGAPRCTFVVSSRSRPKV